MPRYDYECELCGRITEKTFHIADKPEEIRCPACGHTASSIITAPQSVRPDWKPYLEEHLGDEPIMIESRKHRREVMKKEGLEDEYHHKPGMPGQWV